MVKLKNKTYTPISKSCKVERTQTEYTRTINEHRTTSWTVQTAQEVEQSALSRARRTDHSNQTPLRDTPRKLFEHRDDRSGGPVDLRQRPGLD